MNLDPSSRCRCARSTLRKSLSRTDAEAAFSRRSHSRGAEGSRRSKGRGTAGAPVGRVENPKILTTQLASLEILGNVSRHAGKLVRSARQLGQTSPWRFPLSSIGPFSRSFFALRLPLVNSLTSHSLGASAHGRLLRLLLPSLLLCLLFLFLLHSPARPRARLLPRDRVFSIWPVHPHALERVLVRALVRRTRVHARVCVCRPRGCISMYFYARVIAPTVYFYPTRVICNELLCLSLSRARSLAPIGGHRHRRCCEGKKMGPFEIRSNCAQSEAHFVQSPLPRIETEYVTIAHEINTITSKERITECWITVAFLASSHIERT